jgi:hypothetical protein
MKNIFVSSTFYSEIIFAKSFLFAFAIFSIHFENISLGEIDTRYGISEKGVNILGTMDDIEKDYIFFWDLWELLEK